jgi:two-component system, OmpR family, phosphate regulon sensor histidine kinase PhoR
MKLNIRGKLFAVSLALIAMSVLAGELTLRPAVERSLQERIRSDLFVRLKLVVQAAQGLGDLERARWKGLADQLGHQADGRVTFLDAQGAVLGDSEVSLAGLEGLESDRERPEVAAALAGGSGAATRYSATVHRRLLYGAVPITLPSGARGVARLAVPLDEVDAAIARLRHVLWASMGLALLVAVVLSSAAARMLSRALRRMTEAARRMAAGDLDVRMRPAGTDEIAELGRALDAMAESLTSTLTALRTERDLLGVILESMQEGVLVLDEKSRMILVNPALRTTLSLGTDAEGRAALELIRNADLQSILERAQAGQGSVSGEIETTGPKPRRLLVHAASLPSLNRKPQGLLAVFVDVSEIRRLETLRKDFVANVSHELRTPITAVRSAVDTLRHTLDRDPTASERFVDIIDRNAQRLGALVEDLLDLSRIESKEYRPEATPVSLRAVSEQVVGLLRPRVEEKGIEIINDIPSDLPSARADRKGLEQVFTNLLDNAIKYCGPGTRVRLRAAREDRTLRVEIADSGPGIEPRHLPRLFERFYRVDSGRSRDMGGTGLGLSIVKHLVEAMTGAIGVVSTPGRGATFWFTLPAQPEIDPSAPSAPGAPGAPSATAKDPLGSQHRLAPRESSR